MMPTVNQPGPLTLTKTQTATNKDLMTPSTAHITVEDSTKDFKLEVDKDNTTYKSKKTET